ncbi:tRNA (guanosine(37)-N1)-methyltransferase TrmD [Legionella impletisoli]|uniref:tRNA (guanine-N(1)-)-methyltransferase n=1 Tax=Legionella impletisoli TaxID=343510 RepID=A0A917JRX0_9GAMM|nr:tRNA (guanosine(37)-N1)-methyltransferase TrmD [Legionella impletisoli]GGI83789.1 tRNA (guanine-N(1)-)-methyltransferase [Legionella impletisoli]
MMHFGIISILPDMFSCLQYGITGRALEQGLVHLACYNPRDWANKPYRQIDDKPYGGGPGMVMMYEPLAKTIQHAHTKLPANCRTIYLSPQGKTLAQHELNQIAERQESLLFIAGRYEGIDERIITQYIDEEWSLGDFVLSGGELAAMVYIDAITRLLPGSLGHNESAAQDSFMNGLLDYPHFTRPAEICGMKVPEVLLSGNHRDIERWRRKQALGKTWLKRPDLLNQLQLSTTDQALLDEFRSEHGEF